MRKELYLTGSWRNNVPKHRGCQMKRIKASSVCISLLIVSLALIAASGTFGQKEEQTKTSPAGVQAEKQAPATDVNMGYLQTRDKFVMISRGAKGSLYTVKSKDGKVLASKINEKDFEEKYPGLYKQFRDGLAGNDAALRTINCKAPPK
jgi:hypothetical protein